MNPLANIFLNILLMFTNVRHLKFYPSAPTGTGYISFANQSPTFSSSTLVELHINVYRFDDCLFLLDGRLNQLCKLFVTTFHIHPLRSTIINKEKLPNLRHFSLTCVNPTYLYDEVIVPHLQRMRNLEKLALYFVIDIQETFIDGNNLKKNITSHMPRLNVFIFNIRSVIELDNQMYLPSNEDIRQTLTSFEDYEVISCVDYFPKDGHGQCHIYSHPYTLTYYDNITNNFSGRLFNNVQVITSFDERPFEYEFFIQISQAFPFLRELNITNLQPQNYKQQKKSIDDNRNFSPVEYSHLTKLCLWSVHDDYAEQFLLDTKTCLSNYIRLVVYYDQLQRVTQNFTRDATRNNCSKVKRLFLCGLLQLPKEYNTYFPHLE